MFEIFTYWTWVTIFSILSVWATYWLAGFLALAYFDSILQKAGYTRSEARSRTERLQRFIGTPLRVFNADIDKHGNCDNWFGDVKIFGTFISGIYTVVMGICFLDQDSWRDWEYNLIDDELIRVYETELLSFADFHIDMINWLATMLAEYTYWIMPVLVIAIAGQWMFIAIAKAWRKLTPLLNNTEEK